MHARSSFLFLVAAGLLWGTGGVLGTALADATGLSAPAVAAYRLGIGGLVLVAVSLLRDRQVPANRSIWSRIVTIGVLAAIFQSAYFTATSLGSVSSATLITIGSAPMFVLAHDVVQRRSLPVLAVLRPVAIGLVGLGLLIGASGGEGTESDSLIGAAFALASGAAFAAFTLVGRRPPVGDDITVTGYGFVVGGAAVAVCAAPVLPLSFTPDVRSIGLLALFVSAPTALAYVLFFRGLRHSAASTATVVALLEPLTAAVLAVLLLGDQFTAAALAGAVLLLLSVVDSGWSQIRQPKQATPPTVSGVG